MEIYNTLGIALIVIPLVIALWEWDISVLWDVRPIVAILWGIFLVVRY